MTVPQTILHNRYRIVRPLGAGGFGKVYEATDLTLRSRVAVKQYNPQSLHLDEPLWRKLFKREAQMLAQLHREAVDLTSMR